MIVATTDITGRRTYTLPQALADVARELFPGEDITAAVFHLARRLSWHDAHTLENIVIHGGHEKAVAFARAKLIGESRVGACFRH